MIQIQKKIINVLVDGSSKCGKSQLISKISEYCLHEGYDYMERYLKNCSELFIQNEQITVIFYENTNQKYLKEKSEFNIEFHVYLLLFDVNDKDSFDLSIKQYDQYSQKFKSSLKYLIASKCDLSYISIVIQKSINNLQYFSQITNQDVEQFLLESSKMYLNDQQEQFAQQNGFTVFAVSSATKRNVQTIKLKLVQAALSSGLFKIANIQITKNVANRKKSQIQNSFIKQTNY
ncbi:hypothetical protein ABPG72_021083 [Tetrahymena utriculariae]